MDYEDKVIKKLGQEARDAILKEVRRGAINSDQMRDIAYKLHPTVGGNHKRRSDRGVPSDDREMRHILSDWYPQELYTLQRDAARTRLAAVFESEDVGLKPLGIEMKRLSRQSQVFHESFPSLQDVFVNEPELLSILQNIQGNSGNTKDEGFDSIDRLFKDAVRNLNSDKEFLQSVLKKAKSEGQKCFEFGHIRDFILPPGASTVDNKALEKDQKRQIKARIEKVKHAHGQFTVLMRLLEPEEAECHLSDYKWHISSLTQTEEGIENSEKLVEANITINELEVILDFTCMLSIQELHVT